MSIEYLSNNKGKASSLSPNPPASPDVTANITAGVSSVSPYRRVTRSSHGVCSCSSNYSVSSHSNSSSSVIKISKKFLLQTKQNECKSQNDKNHVETTNYLIDSDYDDDKDMEVESAVVESDDNSDDEDYGVPSKKRKTVNKSRSQPSSQNYSNSSGSGSHHHTTMMVMSKKAGSNDEIKEKKAKIIGRCIGQCEDDDPYSHDYLGCKKCKITPVNCTILGCPCKGIGMLIPAETNKRLFSHQIPDHKRSIRVYTNRRKQAIERVERSIEYHNSLMKSSISIQMPPQIPFLPTSSLSSSTLAFQSMQNNASLPLSNQSSIESSEEDIEDQLPLSSIPIIGGMLMLQLSNHHPCQTMNVGDNHAYDDGDDNDLYPLKSDRKRSFSELNEERDVMDITYEADDTLSLANVTECSADSFLDFMEEFNSCQATESSGNSNQISQAPIEISTSNRESDDPSFDSLLSVLV